MLLNQLGGVLGTESEELKEIAENPGIVKEYIDLYTPKLIGFLIQVIIAVLVLFIGIRLIKFVMKLVGKSLDKSRVDKSVGNFILSFIKYALYFVLIMFILSAFGVTTSSVVAILGSAGLTIGLALQGSLANFAGGVLILLIKPFQLGDYIIVKGKDVEGTVTDISLFYTSLSTVDNKKVLIPNGGLSDASIINVSKMDKRRVDITVGVSYQADIKKTKEVLAQVVATMDTILTDENIDIYVSELADSAVVFGVRVWVKSPDYFPTKWALNEKIKLALDENGISIPYNQVDVHIC